MEEPIWHKSIFQTLSYPKFPQNHRLRDRRYSAGRGSHDPITVAQSQVDIQTVPPKEGMGRDEKGAEDEYQGKDTETQQEDSKWRDFKSLTGKVAGSVLFSWRKKAGYSLVKKIFYDLLSRQLLKQQIMTYIRFCTKITPVSNGHWKWLCTFLWCSDNYHDTLFHYEAISWQRKHLFYISKKQKMYLILKRLWYYFKILSSYSSCNFTKFSFKTKFN